MSEIIILIANLLFHHLNFSCSKSEIKTLFSALFFQARIMLFLLFFQVLLRFRFVRAKRLTSMAFLKQWISSQTRRLTGLFATFQDGLRTQLLISPWKEEREVKKFLLFCEFDPDHFDTNDRLTSRFGVGFQAPLRLFILFRNRRKGE